MQKVVVHVIDKNDNIPKFEKNFYSTNVSEVGGKNEAASDTSLEKVCLHLLNFLKNFGY